MLTKQATWIGIDPGASGAIALVSKTEVISVLEYKEVSLIGYVKALEVWNQEYDIQAVCIEKVSAMPGQGVTSMFSFGQRYGELLGICIAMKLPVQLANPKDWQKELKIKTQDKLSKPEKKKAIANAVSLMYPLAYNLITGSKGGIKDGVSDAIAIASYIKNK